MLALCRRLLIHGRVQGVGFRWALYAQARARGLSGWVRNRRDGSVEALLCGPPEDVDALTAWAHHGPPGARVDDVQSNDEPASDARETTADFERRPTF